ncbi:DUF2812 domain-containing protein [Chloroflexota bacterium]|jgi:hypothetical protein
MAENTIRKFKWFWPWQDEQEEAWLMSMSQKGWHLSSVGLPCIYRFLAGEKRDYVYRLDYPMYKKRDQQDYLQLFSDAGWEYLGKMSNMAHYFRKEAGEGETLEIFTDVESKIAKYKRVLTYLTFLAVIYIVFLNNVWFDYPYSWWFIIRVIYLLVMVGLISSIIKLILRIRQLRRL